MSEQKKKNNIVVLVIIIVLVVAIGGYAVFDTQNKSTDKITTTMQEATTTTTQEMTTTTIPTTTETTTEGIEIIDITNDILGDSIEKWDRKLGGLNSTLENNFEYDTKYYNSLIEFGTFENKISYVYVEFGKMPSMDYKFSFFGFDENTSKQEIEEKYKSKITANEKDYIAMPTGEYQGAKFYFTNNKLSSGTIFYVD